MFARHDSSPTRPRAPTPPSGPLSYDLSATSSDDSDEDLTPRGRSIVRTRTIIPAHHRLVSRSSLRRQATSSLRSAQSEGRPVSVLSSGPLPPSGNDDEADASILEPIESHPLELVPTVGSILSSTFPQTASGLKTCMPGSYPSSSGSSTIDFATLAHHNRDHPATGRVTFAAHQTAVPYNDSNEAVFNINHSVDHRESISVYDLSRDIDNDSDSSWSLPFSERFLGHRDTFAIRGMAHQARRRNSSWSSINQFLYHRDTFAVLELRNIPRLAPELPPRVFACLARVLTYPTYLSLRLTCRSWSLGITLARPLRFRAVYNLPAEILQEIYFLLLPNDFDAARRSCRAWMLASLDMKLLKEMLRRGGWLAAARRDLERNEGRIGSLHETWVLSKRLATECALGPGWTGNGLHHNAKSLRPVVSTPQTDGPCDERDEAYSPFSALEQVSETDFEELSEGYRAGSTGKAIHFTASMCGRFVLVAEGCRIYVYRLSPNTHSGADSRGLVSPVSSIICPRRVLAVSMDTSSSRFAVAALLDGRVGLVCNLRSAGSQSTTHIPDAPDQFEGYYAKVYPSCSFPAALKTSTFHSNVDDTEPSVGGPNPGIALERGSRSIYRFICTANDPPLSVAICPQRRCVAFGCASGIELYWVDALTGQDLNRWFPLTSPSDCLYFLPPRKGVGGTKKLRLISSSSGPRSLGARFSTSYGSSVGRQSDEWRYYAEQRVGELSDNHRAVPLSDGSHILYTDPVSGRPCIGTDAPRGGLSKLSQRFILIGPEGQDGQCPWPHCYAVGSELRWGVRIVVGYGTQVWLFCIPGDIFLGEGDDVIQPWRMTVPDGVTIYGQFLARVPHLTELAFDLSPESFTIWAFSSDGLARAWCLRGGDERQALRERAVQADGSVRELVDWQGDILMCDAPRASISLNGGFDGGGDGSEICRNAERAVDGARDIHTQAWTGDEGYWSADEGRDDVSNRFTLHACPASGELECEVL